LLSEFGARRDRHYFIGMRVLTMGNQNACEIAHQTHAGVLRAGGNLAPERLIQHRRPLPHSKLIEGLIIDDYLILEVHQRAAHLDLHADDKLISSAYSQYVHANLEVHDESKSVLRATSFLAWGSEVVDAAGTVAAPMVRRRLLALVGFFTASLPAVTQGLLRRVLALYIHPFGHRRNLCAVFHRAFKFCANMDPGIAVALPIDIREELVCASFLLPFAESNYRWPVDPCISVVDATPLSSGAAVSSVSDLLAVELYRAAEHRGEHVCLDSAFLDSHCTMQSPSQRIDDIVMALPWRITRSYDFPCSAHVNLQELRSIYQEVIDRVSISRQPARLVNGSDSRVSVGAWAKGRSSSHHINNILRMTIGWLILGRKALVNFWLGTDKNPGDHPSRFRLIPPPIPLPADSDLHILLAMYSPVAGRSDDPSLCSMRRQVLFRGICLECFGGLGRYSDSMLKCGLKVRRPIDAYHNRKYISTDDLSKPHVQENLRRDVLAGMIVYTHFGIPCSSWGPLSRSNNGTRSKSCPAGDGTLARENTGNQEADFVAELCVLLASVGGFWSIENPQSSYLFHYAPILSLFELSDAQIVHFDQCMYGLRPPLPGPNEYTYKATSVLSNIPSFQQLHRRCTRLHDHCIAQGVRHVEGRPVSLAKYAGAYPPDLCDCMSKCLFEHLQIVRRHRK